MRSVEANACLRRLFPSRPQLFDGVAVATRRCAVCLEKYGPAPPPARPLDKSYELSRSQRSGERLDAFKPRFL